VAPVAPVAPVTPLQSVLVVVISLSSSLPLPFVSRPNWMVTPPVAQVLPATTDVTRTAAFKPLRLVTVHEEVEPLQTSNWLVLHTYQT
jgi:hypothetical protein